MVAPTEREKSFTARTGDLTWAEDCFPSLFMSRRREMAHPVPTKDFLSPEAAMLSGPIVETQPPPLSAGAEPKSQGHSGSDITS